MEVDSMHFPHETCANYLLSEFCVVLGLKKQAGGVVLTSLLSSFCDNSLHPWVQVSLDVIRAGGHVTHLRNMERGFQVELSMESSYWLKFA